METRLTSPTTLLLLPSCSMWYQTVHGRTLKVRGFALLSILYFQALFHAIKNVTRETKFFRLENGILWKLSFSFFGKRPDALYIVFMNLFLTFVVGWHPQKHTYSHVVCVSTHHTFPSFFSSPGRIREIAFPPLSFLPCYRFPPIIHCTIPLYTTYSTVDTCCELMYCTVHFS